MKLYKLEEYADGRMEFEPFDPDEDYVKQWTEEYDAEQDDDQGKAFYDWLMKQPPSKRVSVIS